MTSLQEAGKTQDMNVKTTKQRRFSVAESRILINVFNETKGRPTDDDLVGLFDKLKNVTMGQLRRWFQARKNVNQIKFSKLGVSSSSYRSVAQRPNTSKTEHIQATSRVHRQKDMHYTKESSSSPSEIIICAEQHALPLRDSKHGDTDESENEDENHLFTNVEYFDNDEPVAPLQDHNISSGPDNEVNKFDNKLF